MFLLKRSFLKIIQHAFQISICRVIVNVKGHSVDWHDIEGKVGGQDEEDSKCQNYIWFYLIWTEHLIKLFWSNFLHCLSSLASLSPQGDYCRNTLTLTITFSRTIGPILSKQHISFLDEWKLTWSHYGTLHCEIFIT